MGQREENALLGFAGLFSSWGSASVVSQSQARQHFIAYIIILLSTMAFHQECATSDSSSMTPMLSVASSHCSAMDTLLDDADSLWDDVGAMRREFSAIVDDVQTTQDDVTTLQNVVVDMSETVDRQGPVTTQLHSSVLLLRDEIGSMNAQMSILKDKSQTMETMLVFLMKANPEAQRIYESIQAQTQ